MPSVGAGAGTSLVLVCVQLSELLERLDEAGVERRDIPDCDDLLVGRRRECGGAAAQHKRELSTTASSMDETAWVQFGKPYISR